MFFFDLSDCYCCLWEGICPYQNLYFFQFLNSEYFYCIEKQSLNQEQRFFHSYDILCLDTDAHSVLGSFSHPAKHRCLPSSSLSAEVLSDMFCCLPIHFSVSTNLVRALLVFLNGMKSHKIPIFTYSQSLGPNDFHVETFWS